ncbi:YfiR family protein [Methylomonas rosea]|uniref:YfiR family protein n=1 Tax=Methylomonas rosea TaxID=2952227 RepID=A0ABT1TQL6_9GAMM|nr:YfiR family protein [Methylomonas sp. WSC-7]MCQ8116903.1 YfiR family protein [Methylomonas sp. WSC-7]
MQKGPRIYYETTNVKSLRCAPGVMLGMVKSYLRKRFFAPQSRRYSTYKWVLACFCLLVPGWQVLPAASLSEAQIKAAYLYNFAKFVEWPADVLPPGADILLCVVGNSVLDGELQALDGRKAGERTLRFVQHNYTDADLNNCHLLFLGSSEKAHFVVTLKALRDAPVLTLSDIDDFAEKGGGISLLFRDNKVVFEVNLEPIRNARLHLPGQLLNIAAIVYGR